MISSHEQPGFDAGAQEQEREQRERLVRLWKKYHFMGEPPMQGSPVEKRLIETCTAYMQHVTNPTAYQNPMKIAGGRLTASDSEDYFTPMRYAQREQKLPSNTSRRDLHNQIALMVVGKQRSGMSVTSAEQLADFASEYIYGCDIAEAERIYRTT